MPELWGQIEKHARIMTESGERETRRTEQRLTWLDAQVRDRLLQSFYGNEGVRSALPELKRAVSEGELTVSAAAEKLLSITK